MKLPRTAGVLSLLSLALLAAACGGGKSSVSRPKPGKVPTATMPANLPDPLMIEGVPTRAAQQSAAAIPTPSNPATRCTQSQTSLGRRSTS